MTSDENADDGLQEKLQRLYENEANARRILFDEEIASLYEAMYRKRFAAESASDWKRFPAWTML